MGEFFDGWRRKLGIVTLLVSCLVMICWMRSRSNHECIEIPLGTQARVTVASSNELIGLAYATLSDPGQNQWEFWSNPGIARVDESIGIDIIDDMKWSFRCAGIRIGQSAFLPDFQVDISFSIISYWMIAIPMAILSASLLLSKSASSIQKKSDTPDSPSQNLSRSPFFLSFRRLLGLSIFVMGCGLAGAWIWSSSHVVELAEFRRTFGGLERLDSLNSLQGSNFWVHVENLDSEAPFRDFEGSLSVDKIEPIQELVFGIPFGWKFDFAGFGYATGMDSHNSCFLFRIPCWFSVFSLVVFSLFLLMFKFSRSATPTNSGT